MSDTRAINNPVEPADKYRWRVLVAASFGFFIYAVIIFNIPPILGILIDTFNISHTGAGFLMSVAVFPSILLSFPFGLLIDRYGTRLTGSISMAVIIIGTVIVALSNSYVVLLLGRLILGIAATMMLVALPKLITTWFAGREIGLAMGIYHTTFPLGNILVLNFAGVLAYNMGWQAPIWVCAALSAIVLLLYAILVRDKKDELYKTQESSNVFKSVRKAGWQIWCIGLVWGLFGAGTIAFFTYGPDYFVTSGKTVAQAGFISSAPLFCSILLAPVVGVLIDRLGKKWLFILIGLIGTCLTLFLIPRTPEYALVLAIIMGIFIAMVTPAVFSIPGEILPSAVQGIAFGVILTCQGLGNVIGPALTGFLRDVTGDYLWSFVGMVIMIVIAIIPILVLQFAHKKKS
jgi:MFS family permease